MSYLKRITDAGISATAASQRQARSIASLDRQRPRAMADQRSGCERASGAASAQPSTIIGSRVAGDQSRPPPRYHASAFGSNPDAGAWPFCWPKLPSRQYPLSRLVFIGLHRSQPDRHALAATPHADIIDHRRRCSASAAAWDNAQLCARAAGDRRNGTGKLAVGGKDWMCHVEKLGRVVGLDGVALTSRDLDMRAEAFGFIISEFTASRPAMHDDYRAPSGRVRSSAIWQSCDSWRRTESKLSTNTCATLDPPEHFPHDAVRE